MLGWVTSVLTSEFVWGTILGILLSILTAHVTAKITRRQQRQNVKLFCTDLVENISGYIKEVEQNRIRNNDLIDFGFLNLIEVEVGIYSRNREHLILIEDASLRKDVREFFNDAASFVSNIKFSLQRAHEAHGKAQSSIPPESHKHAELAKEELKQAGKYCDRLRDVGATKDKLVDRLASIT